MVEVKRKPNESVANLIRRFNELLQKEGVLEVAKKKRFYEKKPNKRQRKKDALYRLAMQRKMEYLKKHGQ
jgi:ribosomal protein S21